MEAPARGNDSVTPSTTEHLQAGQCRQRRCRENPGRGLRHGEDAVDHDARSVRGIDLHVHDAIGRQWQCGTVQLDMALPEKFELEYKDSDGALKRPIMIHRAIFGSIERFLGILIEHFAGKLCIVALLLLLVCCSDNTIFRI